MEQKLIKPSLLEQYKLSLLLKVADEDFKVKCKKMSTFNQVHITGLFTMTDNANTTYGVVWCLITKTKLSEDEHSGQTLLFGSILKQFKRAKPKMSGNNLLKDQIS